MKRYFISPIIGSGTEGDPYRASVSDVPGTNSSAMIPNKLDGTPKFNFAFCIIGTLNSVGVQQVTNSLLFPDYPLDAAMSGMESNTRAAFEQSVEAYDIDGQGTYLDMSFYNNSSSYREVIQGIGEQFEPAFDVGRFDVGEPSE